MTDKLRLENAYDSYKFYLEEFERKGTKKTAIQARKALSLLMKSAKVMRQEIQEEATKNNNQSG